MMDGWYGGNGMCAGGWILMTVFWVVLIAVIFWAGMRLFARPNPSDRSDAARERPEEILDRRLASGEIDADTYDALRDKLRAGR